MLLGLANGSNRCWGPWKEPCCKGRDEETRERGIVWTHRSGRRVCD